MEVIKISISRKVLDINFPKPNKFRSIHVSLLLPGKKPLGRPRHRWDDNIRMNCK